MAEAMVSEQLKITPSLLNLIKEICAIPSPTYHERECIEFIKKRLERITPKPLLTIENDSLLAQFSKASAEKDNSKKKHLLLMGHADVVSDYFPPYIVGDRLHGSGVSDMKAAVALYLYFLENHLQKILCKYNISYIVYAREEGTALAENGLFDLIAKYRSFFETVDLAIVGEPTDNTVQLGCVGSMHAEVVFQGQACHSARPWQGKNALYSALPFIKKISKISPTPHKIFGVTFYDVCSITESSSEKGRTTIPGEWRCNVNFRYAPLHDEKQAAEKLLQILTSAGVDLSQITIKDNSYAGKVVESELLHEIIEKLAVKKQAKQAWTDVAQLSQLGIPCFNYGPGYTSQAHQKNEYISIENIQSHYQKLLKLFA